MHIMISSHIYSHRLFDFIQIVNKTEEPALCVKEGMGEYLPLLETAYPSWMIKVIYSLKVKINKSKT